MTNSTTPAPRTAASQIVLLTSVVTIIPPTIYFVGWLWQSYYLGQFNAGWLGSEVSVITYLERGGRTLLPATVLALVGCFVPKSTIWLRCKWTIWAVYGLGELVLLFTFFVMLFGHFLVAYGTFISVTILNVWSIQVGLCVGVIRAQQGSTIQERQKHPFLSMVLTATLGVIGVPVIGGILSGLNDSNSRYSKLPRVVTHDTKTAPLRLLHSTEKRIYAVDIELPKQRGRVIIVPWESVAFLESVPQAEPKLPLIRWFERNLP